MSEFIQHYNWSDSVLETPDRWPVSLRTLVQMTLGSRVPTALFWGKDLVTFYNDAFENCIAAIESSPGIGQPAPTIFAESWNRIAPAVKSVLERGDSLWFEDDIFPLHLHAQPDSGSWNYSISAVHDDTNTINGVLFTCQRTARSEDTQQVLARRQLEQSEERLRSVVESAPFPIGIYVGPEMRIQLLNQSIIDVWGKGPDLIGKRYADVLPELAGKGIYEQLDGVYRTGKTFHASNQRVDLVIKGELRRFYFKYTFTPLFDADRNVYGVMNTAADVTDLVLAQEQLLETEASLRGAIELAQLGSWELDVATGKVSYSDAIRSWFGFNGDQIILEEVYNPIHPDDRATVATAVNKALAPGSGGVYDAEYRIVAFGSDQERVLHALGKVIYDEHGQPYKLLGTAQDITLSRQRQEALEQLVQLRTAELAAQNEEYFAINEELEEANQLLLRTNENLQQFAYVASHDLQEPLRKIRQFSDLLKTQNAAASGNDWHYLDRIQSAAGRMSVLIRDLLDFSSISTELEATQPVPLETVVNTVLSDLELVVSETGAQVEVGPLPVVQGNALQLGQLFQNLISNALKFRKPDSVPIIRVTSSQVLQTDLPMSVKPVRNAKMYYRIDVTDNGIGFDEKYLDRIFQVFQRLHSRREFNGTGIGLAICEKVVANHGGAITAASQPGEGATFMIFFPV
ncbi:sensor histidine kinase [Dyadobacter sp.]|uniref:sensor histidine kinase n=1 Tax=Dyadobacter sp. TaxID=1914288 RepID=UPI003F723FCC